MRANKFAISVSWRQTANYALKSILNSAWIEWQPSKLHVVGSSPTGCTVMFFGTT